MIIKKYPEIVNKKFHCESCGCSFILTKNDAKHRISVRENKLITHCPCCDSSVPLDVDKVDLFEIFEEILKTAADTVKKMPNSEAKECCKDVIDGIYKNTLKTKEDMKW